MVSSSNAELQVALVKQVGSKRENRVWLRTNTNKARRMNWKPCLSLRTHKLSAMADMQEKLVPFAKSHGCLGRSCRRRQQELEEMTTTM